MKGEGRASARWWDWPAAFLLLIALLVAVGRLVATRWVDHLSIIHTLAVLGVAAGLMLGYSRFAPGVVALFAVIYGLFAVPWQLILAVVRLSKGALWSDRLITFGSRLVNATAQLARQEPVQDPLLFLCSMAFLFWALSVHAAYTLTRYARPWRVILPTGLALVIIHSADPYVPARGWYLAAYFGFALLLLARLTYARLRADWRENEAHVPPLIAFDFSYVVLIATAVLVVLAWTVPSVADVLPTARETWNQATRPWGDRLDNLFASLRRRGAVVTVADYYSPNFALGRGRELTDDLILSIQSPLSEGAGGRYYWRARVYDHYADGQWSTVALSTTRTVARGGLGGGFPAWEGRRTVTFTLTPAVPVVTLYAASQPQWVDRRVEADLAENPDGTLDLAALHAHPALDAGESYQARSSLTSVTLSQLRAAGTDYPDWVTRRYLEIPAAITPRTRELARRIAAEFDTPYDVAAAITELLRTRIRYTETITPAIPEDQEPLDWFLFDLRQGFCNYYASAEVILLRSVGIPARLAVGFAHGERQLQSNTYLVRQHDAHAWPEVYFPGLGWVEFEPTVSQAPISRPLGEFELESEEDEMYLSGRDTERMRLEALEELDEIYPVDEPITGSDQGNRASVLYWVLPVLTLLLIFLIWRVIHRWASVPVPVFLESGVRRLGWRPPAFLRRWAARASMTPLEQTYLEINRALQRLRVSPRLADTPSERAATLIKALPEATVPIQQLLSEYHTAIYSPHQGDFQIAQEAAQAVRNLSWRARIRRLFSNARAG